MRNDRQTPRRAAERRDDGCLKGLGVAPGVAIGPAHVAEGGFVQAPEYLVLADEIAAECRRLKDAVGKARRQLQKLQAKTSALPEAAAEEISFLLDAHIAILGGSRLLRGAERRIVEDQYNAAYAVQSEIMTLSRQFEALEDTYLAARVQDIKDVGGRLIRNLADRPYQAFSRLTEGSIVVAEEITPADTALMDPRRIAGFCSVIGGAEGHTAIMARSLGLPAVLGVPGLMRRVRPGQTMIVDGTEGLVFVDPPAEVLEDYRARQVTLAAGRARLRTLIAVPSRTRDGVDISLQINLELPRDVPAAIDLGADGVGLLRTEFLFMNRDDVPTEDEQYESLREIVEGMKGRPVTIRTLDVGGEKLASALGRHVPESVNPALGLRAIRLSLREPQLLASQLSAILRAGAHGPIRILLPMVTSGGEVRQVKAALASVVRKLTRAGVPIPDPLPPLGVMVEVPAAALSADALAREVDFFALGTNDLIQYTLAIDRGDEAVAHLYDPLHPAVLKLIGLSAEAAGRAGIPVSICGEMAGDPRYTALLIGLGVRDLSMSPAGLLPVKNRIRTIDSAAATRRARMMLNETDSGRIAVLLDDFNDAS